jgi:hypothetical protein
MGSDKSREPVSMGADSRWRRIAASERWRVAGASLVFGAIFSYPMLLRLTQASEQNDWDFESQLMWAPYYTVVHFHQIPLWNPWKCGGMAMLGNPQSRFVTPFFLLHLIFGYVVGAHLSLTLHLAIAWAGGYALARVIGLRPVGAVAAATIFPASSWFSLHMGEGQIHLMAFAYLPWFLALTFISLRGRVAIAAIGGGLLLALTFGEGGAEVVTYSAPLIVVLALYWAVQNRSIRPLLFLGAAGAFGIGFIAVKLVPVLSVLAERGRVPWGAAWINWHDLPQIFFARDQERIALQNRFFIEFGNYISPAFVILAIAGLALGRMRAVPWLIAGWIQLLLLRGDNCAIPLFSWLRELPLYAMLRLSSRFLITFTVCVAMLAGLGAEEAARRFGRAGWWMCVALLAIGALDSLMVGPPFVRHAFDRVPHHFDYSPNFRQIADGDMFDQTVVAQANMGFVHCYEYTPWKTSVIGSNEQGYRGEQYMAGPGTVRLLEWTPDRLTYEVDAPAGTTMIVNQNYEPQWHLAQGDGRVVSAGGLLGVAVGPGDQRLVLVYRGWPFEIGLAITILTFLTATALVTGWPRMLFRRLGR